MSEAFFSDGFKELHRDVVNHLTSDSLHACLPLLAVSKSWRLLAAERIVHDFEERKKALGGGQYLKVSAAAMRVTATCPTFELIAFAVTGVPFHAVPSRRRAQGG